jgi:hypothetical protein
VPGYSSIRAALDLAREDASVAACEFRVATIEQILPYRAYLEAFSYPPPEPDVEPPSTTRSRSLTSVTSSCAKTLRSREDSPFGLY